MKMKSAKGEAKIEERQSDAITVKAEHKLEQGSDGEEGFSQVYTNGHGLIVQIKEEPHSQEISEEHSGDTANCLDTKPDTITDAHLSQGRIKDEFDSDHPAQYEFTEAAVNRDIERDDCICMSLQLLKEMKSIIIGSLLDVPLVYFFLSYIESSSEFFPCPHCTVSFTDLEFLEKHVKWVHQKQYLAKLNTCFSSRTLNLIPKHTCGACSSTFNSKCPECGKKVRTPQSLEDHMRTHTGDRPFVCKDCGRRFVERSGWRQHMKIHTGEKPYKCQVCGKAFLRSHHLKCHLTTHSGKKEYSCSECGKEFGLKSSLDLHLRTHSSERPFHCNVVFFFPSLFVSPALLFLSPTASIATTCK
uniref:C2H2-type domain-containing protein n=1 Tax=Amphilophus citrinellus TaxID=61819 RepID=A0A3Q0RPI1_AMPCI